jgi:hypothetical protein
MISNKNPDTSRDLEFDMLTMNQVQSALPNHLRACVTQELVDMVNTISTDAEAAQSIRDNFVSYGMVLKDGRFKTEDYVHAVAYVSYKLMGYTNREAYSRTFPNRYQALVARGATEKDISAYVVAYNKNKLVNLILEQTIIPTWVLNQDVYQKAINTQLDLMINSKSDKVRSDAANSILTHLKRPEKQQVELSLGIKENSGMAELKDMLTELAATQQELIGKGVPTRAIAHQKLIAGEVVDAEVVSPSRNTPHTDED